jgi:hypothetical protein
MTGPLAPELGVEPVGMEVIAPAYLGNASLGSRFSVVRTKAGR